MAYENGLILIPARYDSHRLPGKALKKIAGKTMIRRTYERAVLSGINTMVVTVLAVFLIIIYMMMMKLLM